MAPVNLLFENTLLRQYWHLLPFAALLLYVVYIRFLSPLAGVPGPFPASLSRLWLAQQSWKGNMHRTTMTLHEKYGPVVRIGPNEVGLAYFHSFPDAEGV